MMRSLYAWCAFALLATAASALPFEIAVSAGQMRFADNLRATVNPINPLPGSYIRDVAIKLPGRYFAGLEVRNTSLPIFRPYLGLSCYRSSFGSEIFSARGYLLLAGAGARFDLGFCGVALQAGAGYDLETYWFSDSLIGYASFQRNSLASTAGLEVTFPLMWRVSTSLSYRFLSKGNQSDRWTVDQSVPNGRTDYTFTPSQQRHMLGFGFVIGL